MSIRLDEIKWIGRLSEFTRMQQEQMARWLDYDTNVGYDPGVIGSAERVIGRANQGSMFCFAKVVIDGLLDKRTGLDPNHSLEERVSVLLAKNGFDKLDHHFMLYGDGSLMVGYEHTGFMVAHDSPRTIIHPATRFAFRLPELEYDMRFGRGAPISGRSLFFYRLVQACTGIIAVDSLSDALEEAEKALSLTTTDESNPTQYELPISQDAQA